MIARLRVSNFRSIESLELKLSRLCALVGENDVGKTNILRAIKTVLVKDWLSTRDFVAEDYHRFDPSRDICIELECDPPLTYQAFKTAPITPIHSLRYTLTRYKRPTKGSKKGDLRLVQECLGPDGKVVTVLREAPKAGTAHKYAPLTSVPASVKAQLPVIYVGPDRRLADQMPSTRYSILRRLLEDVATVVDQSDASGSRGETSIGEVFQAGLRDALSVLRVEEFVRLEALIRRHALENLGFNPDTQEDQFSIRFGLFEPVDFFKAMRLVVDQHDFSVDALDLGDGAQNAVILAVFQAYEQLRKSGAVFIVEEPELHLHPHRARHFYATLRRLSETNQVIYTTHSPHFVTVPYLDEVRLVFKDEQGRTLVREPTVQLSPQSREKLIKELDPERNELFFAKQVILVEGDTEKLALPVYAERIGVDLNRRGTSIVEVGGKRSLELFARIVKALGLKTVIVFDEDSSDFQGERDGEAAYNNGLLARADEMTTVFMLRKNFEQELRTFLGEEHYQAACQANSKVSKAIRARLIALDGNLPVPGFIADILAV
jgi:putative ATP-dependent endonuclease of the OLD family